MSNGFEQRMQLAEELESNFITIFNKQCSSHQIIKYGIESTKLAEAHEYIRICQDDTSKFIRYIPDSVLVSTDIKRQDTTLIEFKAAHTGLYSDKFFNRLIQRECPEMRPPFQTIEDVFNIENEALELYKQLTNINVKVIVVAYAAYRSDYPIRAQYVQDIAVCNVYDPNRGVGSMGSGTHIANANFASYELLPKFFNQHIGIDIMVMQNIENLVVQKFNN